LRAPYFYPDRRATDAFTRNPTPEAMALFAFAISEQNFAFAKPSLASGAGELYASCVDIHGK